MSDSDIRLIGAAYTAETLIVYQACAPPDGRGRRADRHVCAAV
jgi:hypothetical protein